MFSKFHCIFNVKYGGHHPISHNNLYNSQLQVIFKSQLISTYPCNSSFQVTSKLSISKFQDNIHSHVIFLPVIFHSSLLTSKFSIFVSIYFNIHTFRLSQSQLLFKESIFQNQYALQI
ncbi:hypothetical protein HOF65_05965 [bacterium]|nr:hypothetical protein [bacterium]